MSGAGAGLRLEWAGVSRVPKGLLPPALRDSPPGEWMLKLGELRVGEAKITPAGWYGYDCIAAKPFHFYKTANRCKSAVEKSVRSALARGIEDRGEGE